MVPAPGGTIKLRGAARCLHPGKFFWAGSTPRRRRRRLCDLGAAAPRVPLPREHTRVQGEPLRTAGAAAARAGGRRARTRRARSEVRARRRRIQQRSPRRSQSLTVSCRRRPSGGQIRSPPLASRLEARAATGRIEMPRQTWRVRRAAKSQPSAPMYRCPAAAREEAAPPRGLHRRRPPLIPSGDRRCRRRLGPVPCRALRVTGAVTASRLRTRPGELQLVALAESGSLLLTTSQGVQRGLPWRARTGAAAAAGRS